MKKFFGEFKDFISKGNILDLAVGVIIGGAFGKIVSSLVNDIIMPFIVLISGKNSLSELSWTLREAVIVNGVITQSALKLNWGNFLQTIIDFLIIGFTVFLFVKLIMAAKNMGDKLSKEALTKVEKRIKKSRKNKGSEAVESEKITTEVKPPVEDIAKAPDALLETPAQQAVIPNQGDLKNIEALLIEIKNALQDKK